jgi:hypothetical protein
VDSTYANKMKYYMIRDGLRGELRVNMCVYVSI